MQMKRLSQLLLLACCGIGLFQVFPGASPSLLQASLPNPLPDGEEGVRAQEALIGWLSPSSPSGKSLGREAWRGADTPVEWLSPASSSGREPGREMSGGSQPIPSFLLPPPGGLLPCAGGRVSSAPMRPCAPRDYYVFALGRMLC